MLNRTGHFWEQKYYSSSFERGNFSRALNTLRYIYTNPKAARMQQGLFYDFSNYGIHNRLTKNELTKWHPAFLSLGRTLNECAHKYRGFCRNYKPKPKPEKRYYWENKLLPRVVKKKRNKKTSLGQIRFPNFGDVNYNSEVQKVAEKFMLTNCYNPQIAMLLFEDYKREEDSNVLQQRLL